MTTEQWPEAIGLGPLYRRTSQIPELIDKFPRPQPMCEGAPDGATGACGADGPHGGHFLDSEPYENWQDDEGRLCRDGAELLHVDQPETTTVTYVLVGDDDPPEVQDTADEHDYDHELWADADASREGEGL